MKIGTFYSPPVILMASCSYGGQPDMYVSCSQTPPSPQATWKWLRVLANHLRVFLLIVAIAMCSARRCMIFNCLLADVLQTTQMKLMKDQQTTVWEPFTDGKPAKQNMSTTALSLLGISQQLVFNNIASSRRHENRSFKHHLSTRTGGACCYLLSLGQIL